MQVLLDSNILLRWLEPNHPDQLIVDAAVGRLLLSNADLCYTSQNLGEFWNVLTRPPTETDTDFRRMRRIDMQSQWNPASGCFLTDSPSTRNGDGYWWTIASLESRCMMLGSSPQCSSTE